MTQTAGLAPESLLVALPKGRMAGQTLELLQSAGLPLPAGEQGRRLILNSTDGALRYVMAKPADVPTYVEYGAADLGVCGLDTLRESRRQVYEPLLLPFGRCRLSLAGPADQPDVPLRYASQPRVATKYPNLTEEVFRARGVNAEIITLNGSGELGPRAWAPDSESRPGCKGSSACVANRRGRRRSATMVRRSVSRCSSRDPLEPGIRRGARSAQCRGAAWPRCTRGRGR